jgi:hypothetical protein
MALPYDPYNEQAALQQELAKYQQYSQPGGNLSLQERMAMQQNLGNINRQAAEANRGTYYLPGQQPRQMTADRYSGMLGSRLGDVSVQANIQREQDRIMDARNKLFGNADSLLQASQATPDDQMVSDMLRARITGEQNPYGQAERSAYMANATDNAAAGAQAEIGRIRGNPNDPAYQAQVQSANRESLRRQQQARGQYDMQAGAANYAAQGQAANQMEQQRGSQFGRQAAATQYQGNLLAQENATTGVPETIKPRSVPGWTPRA